MTNEKVTYKHQTHSVLDEKGSLLRIQPEGGEEFDAFWVKSGDVSAYVSPEQLAVLDAARKARGNPVVAPSKLMPDIDACVTYLHTQGFTLRAIIRDDGEQQQRVLDEYFSWTGGEKFPLEFINEHPDVFGREWLLTCPYDETMLYPVPIWESGTLGKGYNLRKDGDKTPHGLLNRDTNTVVICYAEVIESLLRAGLRLE